MIGLDTNILVRYLTQDHPEQSERAGRLIETRCTRRARGWIALVVLCELVWVLRGAYRYDKVLIVAVLDQILATAELEVEDEDIATRALSYYRAGSADFADYLIACGNRMAGCDVTYSFDKRLATHAHVREP